MKEGGGWLEQVGGECGGAWHFGTALYLGLCQTEERLASGV